jgi:hypothetical protein
LTHIVILPPSIGALRKGSILISSAMARRLCRNIRPSALAVLRLITSSDLVGCMTGDVGQLIAL